MSLFKSQIISDYNIKEYINGALKLQCAKGANVIAPFNGKLSNGILSDGDNKLIISGIEFNEDGKVKAGDVIGHAYNGYVLVSMKNKDILKYLRGLDTEVKKNTKKKVKTEEQTMFVPSDSDSFLEDK